MSTMQSSLSGCLADLGAWQAGERGRSELPSDSTTGAWSSSLRWEGPEVWCLGVWSQESRDGFRLPWSNRIPSGEPLFPHLCDGGWN